ncbi:MAG: peroxidase family protein [Gammaproteobacteria bacterium]|nr:peroxidase family protein [Gammaproteobacteria bacterium]
MTRKSIIIFIILGAFFVSTVVIGEQRQRLSGGELLKEADKTVQDRNASPVRRIERDHNRRNKNNNIEVFIRSINGTNNNIAVPDMNTPHTQLARIAPNAYSDDISALAGATRPNPRVVSNSVLAQAISTQTPNVASDFLWQWGQFLDHDIDLTEGVPIPEPANIAIPSGDELFDPNDAGDVVLPFNRSNYDELTGLNADNPRQQVNEITGWIDASNVYGSDDERAAELRTLDGTGKLKTSEGNLLPFNTAGLSNAGGPSETLFLAGDVRANEQVGLTAMHTLFVREHNRLATRIARRQSNLSGDEIYQRARNKVAALMQVITYKEFIPVLLGPNALSEYSGYNPDLDASIRNEFSTAAYRLGHSLLSPQILRLDRSGNEIAFGNLSLRDAFFSPGSIINEGGIDPILRGLAKQACQDLDVLIIDDVRNFLFGLPGNGGFDLASLNIQRGRDHGLASYNDTRVALGLAPVVNFADISSNTDIQAKLAEAYTTVNEVDLWVGGLAEDKVAGALVGEVFFAILKDQFERLRDGDRFWYENSMSPRQVRSIEQTSLAQVIRRNTRIGREIQENVFLVNSDNPKKRKRRN